MIAEGREIAAIHPNMVVKIPMTVEGLKAVSYTHLDVYKRQHLFGLPITVQAKLKEKLAAEKE